MAHDSTKHKSLEDFGWEKMHSILDKEIPVKKDNRKFLWWFAGAAAGALLLIAVFQFSKSSPIAEKQIISDTAKNEQFIDPINEKLNPEQYKSENEPAVSEIPTSTSKVQSIAANRIAPQSIPEEALIGTNTKSLSKLVTISQPTITEDTELNPIHSKIYSEAENNTENISIGISETSNKELESVIGERHGSIMHLPFLPRISLETLSFSNSSPNISIYPLSKDKAKWQLGLRVMTVSEKLNGLSKIGAGFFYSKRLNQRVSIDLGLDFTYKLRNQAFASEYALAEADQALANSGAITDPATADIDINSSIQNILNDRRFGQLNIPVAFQYKLSPKWSSRIESSIAYTLISQHKIENELMALTNNASGPNFSTCPNCTIGSEYLQKWNFHAGIGLSYEVNEWTSVNLLYRFILNGVNNQDPFKTSLDGNELKLSFQYRMN